MYFRRIIVGYWRQFIGAGTNFYSVSYPLVYDWFWGTPNDKSVKEMEGNGVSPHFGRNGYRL